LSCSVRAGPGHPREDDLVDSNPPPNVTEEAVQAPEAAPTSNPVPAASPADAGSVVVVEPSGSRAIPVAMGEQISIGSDPGSRIVVVDPRVPPACAVVVRTGPGWLVASNPSNPIRILDETGRARPVLGELGLVSGTLLAGTTQILLQPPAQKP
jgi:hypothetical protein